MNNDLQLSDREKRILHCIIDSYIESAKPAGSRFLAKRYGLGVSPATIRNVMNDLEDYGLIGQPHVSAGRIPTDKGYRVYVDNLMSVEALAKRDRSFILKRIKQVYDDANSILEVSSGVLGQISSQLGVVLAPRFYQGVFQKMELISLSDTRVLAVISIESGLIKTITIEIKSEVSRAQLEDASMIINERLSGLSLKEVKENIDRCLAEVPARNEKIIRYIIKASHRLFDFDDRKEIHYSGAHNIVSNPELLAQNEATRILADLESKREILHLLSAREDSDFSISIGEENNDDLFRNFSVITTRYRAGNVTGMLGVVGPTRMRYERIVPLVNYVGKVLTQTFRSHTS